MTDEPRGQADHPRGPLSGGMRVAPGRTRDKTYRWHADKGAERGGVALPVWSPSENLIPPFCILQIVGDGASYQYDVMSLTERAYRNISSRNRL